MRQRLRDSGILQCIHSMRNKEKIKLKKKKSFLDSSDSKESACNEGNMGLILGFSSTEDTLEESMATHCSIFA